MNEQEQDLRICNVCGTKNEDDYTYCKSCGTVLPASQANMKKDEPVAPPPFVSSVAPSNSEPLQNPAQPNDNTAYSQAPVNSAPQDIPPYNSAPQDIPPYNSAPQGNPAYSQPPYNSAPQGNPQYGQPPFNAGPQGTPPYGQQQFNAGPQGTPPPYGQAPYGAGQYPPPPRVTPVPDTIDGVPTADIAAFVGSKQEYFIPKFAQHAGRSSFASWNWPVFLFAFLLKVPFVWFFYRKMYKAGSAILAIWIVLTAIVCGTMFYSIDPIFDGVTAGFKEAAPYMTTDNGYSYNYNYNYNNKNSNSTNGNYYSQNDQKIDDIMNKNIEKNIPEFLNRMPYLIIGSVFAMALLALYILSAIYANSMYKNHVLKKINELKYHQPQISSFELTLHGGTSAGLAIALGIIIPILMSFVGMIWMFSVFSDMFSALML